MNTPALKAVEAFFMPHRTIARAVSYSVAPATRVTLDPGAAVCAAVATAADTAPVLPSTTMVFGASAVMRFATTEGSDVEAVSSSGAPTLAAKGAAARASV